MKNLKWLLTSLLLISISASAQGIQDLISSLNKAAEDKKQAPLKINEKYKLEHEVSHRIHFETLSDADSCSATTIGRHALLTAAHCQLATDKVSVDGTDQTIVTSLFDGNDHSILLLEGEVFTSIADIDSSEPVVGDELSFFGNPLGYHDLLRSGQFVGRFSDEEGVHWMLNMNVGVGDSGAGVFNDSHHLVSIISQTLSKDAWSMGSMFPLKFTQKQLDEARTY